MGDVMKKKQRIYVSLDESSHVIEQLHKSGYEVVFLDDPKEEQELDDADSFNDELKSHRED